jgi:hypothetical protein
MLKKFIVVALIIAVATLLFGPLGTIIAAGAGGGYLSTESKKYALKKKR